MQSIVGVCLIAIGICGIVAQQNPAVPAPLPAIHVQLAVSSLAAAMPETDKEDTTEVTVEGDLYLGVQPIQVGPLAGLRGSTVYVKAGARASSQRVLSVVSGLEQPPASPAHGSRGEGRAR